MLMSRRLQVLMNDAELRAIKLVARRERLSVAEWVRRALREARQRVPERSGARKRQAIEAALEHAFPSTDIGVMLGEIERGYQYSTPR